MSKSNRNLTTPADSSDEKQIEAQVILYPNVPNQRKLEIVTNLYSIVQAKTKRIIELQAQIASNKIKAATNQSNINISTKLDEIIRKKDQASKEQIKRLTDQNIELNKKLNQFKKQRETPKQQIKLHSFLEKQNSELKDKFISFAQDKALKLQNETLINQNRRLKEQFKKYTGDFTQFTAKWKKEFEEIKIKYSAEEAKRSSLQQQISRLKQDLNSAQQSLSQKQKELNEIKTSRDKLFSLLKETLSLTTSSQTPNKLKDYLTPLTLQEFAQNSKRDKIKQLIGQSNKAISDLRTKAQTLEQQKISLKTEINNKDKDLQIQTQNAKNADSNNQNLRKQIQKLAQKKQTNQQRIRQLQKDLATLENKYSSQQAINQNNVKKISSQSSEIESLKKIQIDNKQIIANQHKKISKLETQKKTLQVRGAKLAQEFGQLNKKSQSLQKLITQKSDDIEVKKGQIKKLQDSQELLQGKLRKLTFDFGQQKKLLEKKQAIADKLEDDIKILNTKYTNISGNLETINSKFDKARERINELQTILNKINKELIGEASHYYLGQTKIIKSITSENLKQSNEQIRSLLNLWKEAYNRVKFFNGSEIITKDNIEFVLDTLDDFMGCTPYESKLVYKYDPLNQVNFHNYFDGVENLIAFIKLMNGTIIGGFTVYPIDPDRIQRPGKGFLFSLTGKKIYHVRSDAKLPVVTYDNYYFIFGNAEIRLKSQEKKVFSNFGISNSTFDNGADPRTRFLDVLEMANNELEIETYEFYRMNFKL